MKDNTYNRIDPAKIDRVPTETVIGDEKQTQFNPYLKVKSWDNETNFSIGLKELGGTHQVDGDIITYTKGNTKARFYPTSKTELTAFTNSRYLKQGSVDPLEVPILYELNRHIGDTKPWIMTYTVNTPSLMYFGDVSSSEFTARVDIPEVRAATGISHNPYYMDSGLPMIDVMGNGAELNLELLIQATIDVFKGYNVDLIRHDSNPKLYWQNAKGQHVKLFSPELSEDHIWTYINLNTDYLKAYDYYKPTKEKKINDHYAYGIQTEHNIPDTVVDEVVQRFAVLSNISLEEDNLTTEELTKINDLKPVHQTSDWVYRGNRTDWGWWYDNRIGDGYEFEVTFDTKPSSNLVPLSVQHKGLKFYYQDDERGEGIFQPIWAKHSYAVYHNSKTNNQYKTGKAFHIQRPFVTDANGASVWCDLDPGFADSNGVPQKETLNLTIPQDFLDNATYPITIDPTFGYTSIGASEIAVVDNIRSSHFALSENGDIDDYYSYMSGFGGYKGAIYDHSDDSLIDGGGEISTAGWGLHTGVTGSLTSGDYWLSMITGSAYVAFKYDTGSTNQGSSDSYTWSTSDTDWPDPLVPSLNNQKFSAYVNYTATGGTETASLSVVLIDLTVQAVTATFSSVAEATAPVTDIDLTVQTVTATYNSISTAGLSEIDINLTPQSITATSVSSFNASVSEIPITLTPQAITATYNQVNSATLSPLDILLTVQSVAATYAQVNTVSLANVDLILTVQSITATYSTGASLATLDITLAPQAVTATYDVIGSATAPTTDITISAQAITATYDEIATASLANVDILLATQSVTATSLGVYPAGVATVNIDLIPQSVTATYDAVKSAVSPVVDILLAPQAITATHNQAAVTPVTDIQLAPQTVTATYDEVDNATTSTIDITLSLQSVTATYNETATLTSIDILLTTQSTTATSVGVYSAGSTAVDIDLITEAVTATYGGNFSAGIDLIDIDLAPQAITATYQGLSVASLTTVGITLQVQSISATFEQTATIETVDIILEVQTITATYQGVVVASLGVTDIVLEAQTLTATYGSDTVGSSEQVPITLTVQDITATFFISANISEVPIFLSLQTVTATHHSQASISETSILLTTQDITATYDSVVDATTAPILLTVTTQAITAIYQIVATAQLEPVLSEVFVQSLAATFNETATVSEIPITLSTPDLTASSDIALPAPNILYDINTGSLYKRTGGVIVRI